MRKALSRLAAWVRYKLCSYPIARFEPGEASFVGVDSLDVTHALAWRFDEAEGLIEGRCGATVSIRGEGTVDCMTCLAKETR